MTQYLVAIHLPDDFDPSLQPPSTRDDISTLNRDMVAAGVRTFVGGLEPARAAKSITSTTQGQVLVTDGPYAEAKEYVGGLWVLDCATLDEAIEWGRKATIACRAPVEVRAFH